MEHCKSLRGTPRILSRYCICVSTLRAESQNYFYLRLILSSH